MRALLSGIVVLTIASAAPAVAVSAAGGTIIVDRSGGGDLTTIKEALAVAEAGDTVLVRPGTYTEAVTIDVDITLVGDGPREDIVIVAPEQVPVPVSGHVGDEHETFAILLKDTDATVSDLTVRGESSVIIARGGAPTVTRLVLDGVGIVETSPDEGSDGTSIVIDGGSAAVIRENELRGGGPIAVYEGSTPLIEANRLAGGPRIFGVFGDAAVIRGNSIEDTPARPSIILWEGAGMLVEGNTITDAGREGIGVRAGSPTIRGNTITGAAQDGIHVRQQDASPVIVDNAIADVGQAGISVSDGAPVIEGNSISRAGAAGISALAGRPAIRANALRDNVAAIVWSAPAGVIVDNDVAGGRDGILVGGGSPTVSGNSIADVERRGLFVGLRASPTLSGNTSCGNGEDLVVEDGASATVDDTNEICGDVPG
jgi:F-box protein 11